MNRPTLFAIDFQIPSQEDVDIFGLLYRLRCLYSRTPSHRSSFLAITSSRWREGGKYKSWSGEQRLKIARRSFASPRILCSFRRRHYSTSLGWMLLRTHATQSSPLFCMAGSLETAAAIVQCSAHGTTDRSVLNVRWMNALRRRASYASYSYCVCVYIYVCDSILHLDCLHGQYATRSCINYLPQSFSSSDL